jgi:hypothetical protein
MPTSVLRRYTPPTCTLEIIAAGSPLSRWTDRPVVKNLHFQLSFDDPRLIHEDHITLKGDRPQLEALSEAVTTYVQQLLDPGYISPGSKSEQTTTDATNDARDATNSSNPPNRRIEERLRTIVSAPRATSTVHHLSNSESGIYLKPNNLVSHELILGSLANEESGSSIQLSALQLFDLANALDEYAADLLALPALGRSSRLSSRRWLQAAAVLVLAAGVTTSIFKYVTDFVTPQSQPAATESAAQAPNETQTFETAQQPTTPPAETRIPADLRPLPRTALSPNQPANRQTQPANRGRTQARRPAPSTAPNANQARPIPALPPLAPVAPQGSAAPPSVGGSGRSPQPLILSQPPSAATAPTARIDQGQSNSESAMADLAPSLESQNPASLSTIPQPSASSDSQSSTMFDVVPQVAEARDAIQQAWMPTPEVAQTLEYRVLIGADGSVLQVTPLGEASRIYFDRTGIPTVGNPFVSPLTSGQSARIRLVLSPDGRVQSFLESLNESLSTPR